MGIVLTFDESITCALFRGEVTDSDQNEDFCPGWVVDYKLLVDLILLSTL
jgi:hypothetical protein